MSRLINNLMDVVRLRVGQPLELHRQRSDLVQVVREVIAEYASDDMHTTKFNPAHPAVMGMWDSNRLEEGDCEPAVECGEVQPRGRGGEHRSDR